MYLSLKDIMTKILRTLFIHLSSNFTYYFTACEIVLRAINETITKNERGGVQLGVVLAASLIIPQFLSDLVNFNHVLQDCEST